MKISLLKFENIKIELLEPIKEETIIQKFINKHGEGIHHIAFRVSNIKKMMEDLKYEEVRLIYNDPKLGSNNNLINFLHPKAFNGVLIELCQKQPSSC
jgi:methylmalonyl-CoA epimerase